MDAAALEVTIISADGLKNVRKLGGTMRTYAVVCSNDNVNSSASTRINKDDGCNPVWNEKLQLRISSGLHACSLNIQIYCNTSFGKRVVGRSKVPLSDITLGYGAPNGLHYLSYRLRTKNGKRSGTIDLSLRILTQPNRPQMFNPSISKFPGQGSYHNSHPFSKGMSARGRHQLQQNTAVNGVPSTWMGYPQSQSHSSPYLSAPTCFYPPPQY
ncbi:hypothetical protein SUGI_1200740 [Cryptomeria japonica]|uniref:BON1-associated protein 2-like n=1 Tax=Cryptomeria japonica TaxID=3369 RepID=UPI00241492DB|nr:BON1-associated protein 2-like [Cryptomeria japonica]GLJ55932.1 hypothetical protein SUGI_1200740 [Cryptomeria japonica]